MKKQLLFALSIGLFTTAKCQTYDAGTVFFGYADIDPDSLLNYTTASPGAHESLFLNMFGDAGNDIELRADGSSSPGGTSAYINIISLNPDVYIRFGRLDSVYVPAYSLWNVTKVALPLAFGDAIDPAGALWNDTMLYMTDHSSYGGGAKDVNDWIGGERYIGLKYQSGSSVAYGWIRMHFDTEDSTYVKEYAYTPAIVGIPEKMEDNDIAVYPNPVNDNFSITGLSASAFSPQKLKLTDVYGKEVKYRCTEKENRITINLDPSTQAGCYFLLYESEGKISSKKIIKL